MKVWLGAYTKALLLYYPGWTETNADKVARSITNDFLSLFEEPLSPCMVAACKSLGITADRATIVEIVRS